MQARTGSVVVGTVQTDDQCHKTMRALRAAGFTGWHTGTATDTGEIVVQNDSLARADVAGKGLYEVLVGMGAPETEARLFEREFAARRTVVTVQCAERPHRAAAILRGNHAALVRRW